MEGKGSGSLVKETLWKDSFLWLGHSSWFCWFLLTTQYYWAEKEYLRIKDASQARPLVITESLLLVLPTVRSALEGRRESKSGGEG